MSTIKTIVLLGAESTDSTKSEYDFILHTAAVHFVEKQYNVIVISQSPSIFFKSHPTIRTYPIPLDAARITEVLVREKPDYISAQFGGDTAILCLELLRKTNILEDASITIFDEQFKCMVSSCNALTLHKNLREAQLPYLWHQPCNSISDLKKIAAEYEYPFNIQLQTQEIAIASDEQLDHTISHAHFDTNTVAFEDITGWKKIDVYSLRDKESTIVFPCITEYVDPVGVHSQDSVVVFPSQTLPITEIVTIQKYAEEFLVKHNIIGLCCLHFGIHTKSRALRIITVKPYCSEEIVFAIKASGCALIELAIDLQLGTTLAEVDSSVFKDKRQQTIALQMPCFDIHRYALAKEELRRERKSSGSVFALGTTFEEVLQKAVRMVYRSTREFVDFRGEKERLKDTLRYATPERIFAISYAFLNDWTVEEVGIVTNIDHFFLGRIFYATELIKNIKPAHKFTMSKESLRKLKQAGFSDAFLAHRLEVDEMMVRNERIKNDLIPVLLSKTGMYNKQQYWYCSYFAEHTPTTNANIALCIIGSGPDDALTPRIYDIYCKAAAHTFEQHNYSTALIECSTNTLPIQTDECTYVIVEETSIERLHDIYRSMPNASFVVQISGKNVFSLVYILQKESLPIHNLSAQYLDLTRLKEDVYFTLNTIQIQQPNWSLTNDPQEIRDFIRKNEYPVICSTDDGEDVMIIRNSNDIEQYIHKYQSLTKKTTILTRKFFDKAQILPCEFVAKDGDCLTIGIVENIELSHVHKEDSIALYPPQSIPLETLSLAKRLTRKIIRTLKANGPGSITFAIQNNSLYVLDYTPYIGNNSVFLTQASQCNFLEISALSIALHSEKILLSNCHCTLDVDHVAIQSPTLLFSSINASNPVLTTHKQSVGASISVASTSFGALRNVMTKINNSSQEKSILLSIGRLEDKLELLVPIQKLAKLGFTFYCTQHTHDFLVSRNIASVLLHHISEPRTPNAREYISHRRIRIAIIIPNTLYTTERTDGYIMRRLAVDANIPLFTSVELAKKAVHLFIADENTEETILSLPISTM